MGVFWDESNIWISSDFLKQTTLVWWPSSNHLKAWKEQKGWPPHNQGGVPPACLLSWGVWLFLLQIELKHTLSLLKSQACQLLDWSLHHRLSWAFLLPTTDLVTCSASIIMWLNSSSKICLYIRTYVHAYTPPYTLLVLFSGEPWLLQLITIIKKSVIIKWARDRSNLGVGSAVLTWQPRD